MYYSIEINSPEQYESVMRTEWPFSRDAFVVIKQRMVHADTGYESSYLNDVDLEDTWREYHDDEAAGIDLLGTDDVDFVELRNNYNASDEPGFFMPYDPEEFRYDLIRLIENKLNYEVFELDNGHLLIKVD